MPGGDRTGPRGMGPMTGRGFGYCAGTGLPGHRNAFWGRGFLRRGRGFRNPGFGGGRGWRNWFYATGLPGGLRYGDPYFADAYPPPTPKPDPEQEKQFLRNEAEALQDELESIKKRLDELEKNPPAEES